VARIAGRAVEQSRRCGARRAGHVLAVVEHDQEVAGAQVAGDGLGQGPAAFRLLDAEHGRDLGQDEFPAVDWRQVDEPCPLRELGVLSLRQLDRQAGLAAAAAAGQGQQAMSGKQAPGPLEFGRAAHEAADRKGEIAHRAGPSRRCT
jgi:hypothetical protein